MAQARRLRNPRMGLGPPPMPNCREMAARAERRAMIALIAVFVLVAQALAPAAMASPLAYVDGGVICVSQPAGDHGEPAAPAQAAGHCQHCVCPVGPALAAPAAQGPTWTHPFAILSRAIPRQAAPPPARPPPRPPGQGPPTNA